MTESRAVASAQPQRQVARVENVQPMLDTDRFEHFQRAASALMHSSILNPSIRGESPQQCFSNLMLVFDLSDRWKLPAMSIAQCISIVHNKVVYEGKLIQAAMDASLGVTLYPWWCGERGALDYRIYLSDTPWDDLDDDALANLKPGVQMRGRRIIDGSVAEWRTFGKDGRTPQPAWTGAATQNQLLYRGSREWARRFEPAVLLGVYGDDEIEQIQARMDRARDVTPAAPGLTGGFTRPAAQPEAQAQPEPEDADIEEIAAEGDAQAEPAQDAQDAQEAAQDAQVEDEAADEPEAAEEAQAEPHGEAQPQGPTEDDIADRAKAAYEATFCGFPHTYEGEDVWPDEARKVIDAQAQVGADAFDDALELAYQQGRAGQVMTELQPPVDATGLTARWKALRAEWEKGQADAAADSKASPSAEAPASEADAVDADTDDAETDALAGWTAKLLELNSWADIKAALHAFSQTPEWKAMGPEDLSEVRSLAWARQNFLIMDGQEKFDFLNDLTAFRCWIEWTEDADAIEGNWQAIASMPHFQNLGADQQKALATAVQACIAALGGGE